MAVIQIFHVYGGQINILDSLNDSCIKLGSNMSHFTVSLIEGQRNKTVSVREGRAKAGKWMDIVHLPASSLAARLKRCAHTCGVILLFLTNK